MLLLAAGGDPHREIEPNGRAATALAEELDLPARRTELTRALEALRSQADGLPIVAAALDGLLRDSALAWRAFAAGVLGEELAD